MAEGGALRELIAHLGVEVDTEKLDQFEDRLEGAKHKLFELGKVLLEVFGFHEIKEFVEGQIEVAARLDDVSERLGISTEALQKFQFAARLGGVESEEAAHSLGLFTRQLGEAGAEGGEAAKTLNTLGIRFKGSGGQIRDVIDIVGDVADKFKDLDPQQRAAYSMKLFGRAGLAMVPVLKEGREGLEGLYKEFDQLGGGMGKEFIERAKKTDDEILKLKFGWQSFKSVIAGTLLPVVNKVVDLFKDVTKQLIFITKHTHAVEHAFTFLKGVGIVTLLYQIAKWLATIDVEEALAALPVILFTAAVVALYLAFDDLATMIEGGRSVLGDFLDEWGPLGAKEQVIAAIKDAVKTFSDAMSEAWQLLKDLAAALNLSSLDKDGAFKSLASQAADFFKMIDVGVHNLKAMVDMLVAIKKGDWKGVSEAFGESSAGGLLQRGLSGPMKKAIEDTGGGLVSQSVANAIGYAGDITKPYIEKPAGQLTAPAGASTTVHTGDIKVEVKAPEGSDPPRFAKAVGQGVKGELDKMLTNTLNAQKKK